MNNLQKSGGIAALGHAAAYLVGLVLGLILMFPLLDAAPDQYLKFLADNQALVYLWNLISYWGSAITLVVMVLALYERLKGRSPALMQTATVFGLIWAGLIIASGNLMLHNIGVVAELYRQDPAQAVTAWTALQSVENRHHQRERTGWQPVGAAVERGRTADGRADPSAEHPRRGSRRRGYAHDCSGAVRYPGHGLRAGHDRVVCLGGDCPAAREPGRRGATSCDRDDPAEGGRIGGSVRSEKPQ